MAQIVICLVAILLKQVVITKYTNTITAVLNLAVGDAMTVAVYNKDGDASGDAYVNTNSTFMGFKLA